MRLLLKAGALPSVPASGEAALPLLLSARQGSRSLYLTLFDTEHPNSFRRIWVQLDPRAARARFRHDGVTGHIGFMQTSSFHPVQTDVALFGLNNSAGTFHIHELPVPGLLEPGDAPCGQTGQHYNPFRVDANSSPPAGQGSTDQYEVGDLSANIEPKGEQGLLTAVATGGRVVFRQEKDAPLSDTMVYVEGLLYTDGSKERTDSHAWHVHMQVPGKDFFNWTGRCKSAGGQFNPYRVSREEGIYLCTRADGQVGDRSGKYGNLDELKSVKEVHNDTSLPMYGLASIIGRSVVLHRREGEWWGWYPDEASQVTAIDSFHNPNGFAWDYIRFSQVVYNNGSSTDTILQVRLKHPGKTNREQTLGTTGSWRSCRPCSPSRSGARGCPSPGPRFTSLACGMRCSPTRATRCPAMVTPTPPSSPPRHGAPPPLPPPSPSGEKRRGSFRPSGPSPAGTEAKRRFLGDKVHTAQSFSSSSSCSSSSSSSSSSPCSSTSSCYTTSSPSCSRCTRCS
jgi:Cu/Zn superoxide dismutase